MVALYGYALLVGKKPLAGGLEGCSTAISDAGGGSGASSSKIWIGRINLRSTGSFTGLSAMLILLATVGCQPTVYLMPTPEAIGSGKIDPFLKENEFENRSHIAYVTNRLPLGLDDNRQYLTLFDENLRLGIARIRIGGEADTWEVLRIASTTRERENRIPLTLEKAEELAMVPAATDSTELSSAGRAFFTQLNAVLARNPDPDLIIYVHGANSNFYRASAQASQLQHFSGRNTVVMLFAWPSAESLLRYAVDVDNARATVPVFARLLELLGKYSSARFIDILAYSAGAQVVSPALALLSERGSGEGAGKLKERLRLGEIYFAAPDVNFAGFLDDLANYIDLPSHVTLALNPDDSVLAFASQHHGASRAGKPDSDELTAEETQWVMEATRRLPFDVIWIDPETLPGMSKGAHDFWYSHPWVSTDILVQLLYQARPADRGLAVYDKEGDARLWYYPEDYPERITPAIRRLQRSAAESGQGAGRSVSDR